MYLVRGNVTWTHGATHDFGPAPISDARSPRTTEVDRGGRTFPMAVGVGGGVRRDTESWPEQVPNRWLMQIRRRHIAQMLKNGRLKICESVPSPIGETRPRNTRNKPADVSTVSPLHASRLFFILLGSSEAFLLVPHVVPLSQSTVIYFSFTYVYF